MVRELEPMPDDIEQLLMATLYRLDNLRRIMKKCEWKEFCSNQSTNFPIHRLLLNDPFTKRSYELKTNQLMDQKLMDFLTNKNESDVKFQNTVGARIYDFVNSSDLAKAIRHQGIYISAFIDQLVETKSKPISILSIFSRTVKRKNLESFHTLNVENVNDLRTLKNGILTNRFDLVYSTELLMEFKYQDLERIIPQLFELVKVDGYLLVTAFREEIPNSLYRTYFEAFAHWFIRYYTDEDLIDLFSSINPNRIFDFQLTTDPCCNIAYILIRKK